MKLVFFGSPAFALPALLTLKERHEVALVVSQPDKPAGRGMIRAAPAVAREAGRLGLTLAQPAKLKGNEEFQDLLAELQPDIAITVAYGKLLPQSLLDLPRAGFLNVHASLLPKYRGAAPVQWALICGERETGVSIMQTEMGLDTGPVCLRKGIAIEPHEEAPQLFERLSLLGAKAISEALELLERGELHCRPQEDSLATMAPLLHKEDGDVDWQEAASAIYNRFRGTSAWPGMRFEYGGKSIRIHEMRPAADDGEPGRVIRVGTEGVTVAASEGSLTLISVQAPGKGRIAARDWANGYQVRGGTLLA
ncbi:MAG: methionyl-tRNA formyltransferase [Trueperaceae bacterium]